ncbi:MAG: hypothetical protein L0Y71_12500 [Gemmataceae bacterium]|nr:hypothetical protein [Gemmataceae bacterium]
MDAAATNLAVPTRRLWNLAWVAALTVVLAWQAWLTLGLFGAYPWRQLLDDQPIISGAHPQHLHFGKVGAEALRNTGRPCAYDPAFQAGYPKTPIFNGSRLAEVFLYAGGGNYRPAAYKLGVASMCLLVPLLLIVAARGIGLDRGAALVAAAVGILIWWGPHSRAALEAGDSDLFVGALAILAHVGSLVRFDREPGLWAWLGVLVTGALGWFAQPLLLPIALPLLLLYYLCAGVRHPHWQWHVALLAAQLGTVAVNLPWLLDWVSYWWLRLPLPDAAGLLPHRTLQTVWDAPIWGGAPERALALSLFGSALVGIVLLYLSRQRPTARLLLLGTLGLLALALLGISWEPLGLLGTQAMFAPALWFAAIPAAFAWTWLLTALLRSTTGKVVAATALSGLATAVWLGRDFLTPIYTRAVATQPLRIGLGPEREAVVARLIEATTKDARILWEDRPLARTTPRWSALLPLLTQRQYLGGLDPDGFIEHSAISFLDQLLEGRHISTWTDRQLEEYCRRYNVGWVVCWTPAAIKRFTEWQGVESSTPLVDDVAGYLFTLQREDRSYALKGQARLLDADPRHITLGDVVPDDDGVVVLSLHWQAGLRAAPSRVQVEREACGHDPIGFIRLRMASPVARVTLTWSE